ncbi:MAG: lysostaphin resistance A-like protein [Thermoanaerobaculales bacterium]
MNHRRRDLYGYLILVFLLGYGTQMLAVRAGLSQGGRFWVWLTMWTPAVAVLVVSSRTRKLVRRSFHMRGLRFVPLGIAVGWSQILLTKLFLVLAGRYRWDTEHFPLATDGNGVAGIHGLGTLLGPNAQSFAYLALNLLLSIALASIVNAVIGGLGEELGWRVFLQPFLEARKGPLRGTLLVGLIWAFWHLPANLAGYNDGAHPIVSTFLLFPAGVVSLAFAFAWLYRYSGGSVWAVAVAHGANNALASGFVVTGSDWWSDQAASLAASAILIFLFGFALTRASRNPGGPPAMAEPTP